MDGLVAVTILSLSALGFLGVSVSSKGLAAQNRQNATANAMARQVVEQLKGETFSELFARYNTDAADDPGGAGTAPGDSLNAAQYSAFFGSTVTGTKSQESHGVHTISSGDTVAQLQNLRVAITVPSTGAGGKVELREDANLPALGFPRDLNGDGAIDSLDHSGDYRMLPVLVTITWTTGSTNRSLNLGTVIVRP